MLVVVYDEDGGETRFVLDVKKCRGFSEPLAMRGYCPEAPAIIMVCANASA